MAGGQYTIRVHGVLDDTQIRAQLAAIQKEYGFFGKKAGKGAGAYMASTGKGAKKGAQGMSAYIKGTEKATKSTKRFGQSTIDITKKVVQFGATTAVIRGVTSGMADMVNKTFELDSALTEYKKVSDLSGKSLEKYTDQAFKAGRQTARTGTEMIEAATQFKKMGYDDQMSMKLATTASMFQNIADVEIDAGQAALFINSQLKAFNGELSVLGDEGKQATHVIDAVNEVANNFGVGTNDLQLALTKTSSAMGGFGNSFEQTIGIITAGTEVMVGQPSKVARGWRTIGANITKVAKSADEYSAASGKVNIAMRDQNGNMKNTYDILSDLHNGIDGVSAKWSDLTKEEQTNIAMELAGKNHMEVFMATMGNFEHAIEATEKAYDSQGSAARENARALESLQGHLQNLKSAWSEFSNSMVKSEGLKKGMDAIANFLRFLSSDAGHNLLGMAAGLTATYLAAKPLIGLFRKGKAIKDFMAFAGAFGKTGKTLKAGSNVFPGTAKKFTKMSDTFVKQGGKVTKATKGLGTTSAATATAMNPLVLAVAAVGTAMALNAVGIYKAYKEAHKYREAADELTVSNQKSVKSIEDNAKRAEFLTETLDRLNGVEHKTQGQKELLKQTIKELNELYPDLNLKYDEEKDKINKTTDAIRDYIKAMQDEAKAAAYKSNLEKSVKQQLKLEEKRKKAIDNLTEAQKQYDKEVQSGYVSQATSQRLAKAKTEFKDLQAAYIQTSKEVTKQSNNMVKSSGAWDKLAKKAKKAGTEIPDSIKEGIEDGTYAIPESMKQLESLISLDEVSQKIKQTPIGKNLAESLEQGLREGKLDISQALNIEQEMSKMGGKMTKEGKDAVQGLVDQFNSGQIDFSQFESGLKKISGDVKKIDKTKAKPQVDLKGGKKVEKESKNINKNLKKVHKTKAKPKVELKGGKKVEKESKNIKKDLKAVHKTKAKPKVELKGGKQAEKETGGLIDKLDELPKEKDVKVSETGAPQATGEVGGLMGIISALFGKTVNVSQTGAEEATGEVSGLEGEISGLSGNTVAVQEQGAAPSTGRVGALNSIINKLRSRTVQETAKTSGTGGVASLVSYQNSLHSKTVTYTAITKKVNQAHGTKSAPEGLAEVNEYGYEYIRDAKTGMLRVANKGRRGLTVLNKGDTVYTHGQSLRMKQEQEEELPHFKKGKKGNGKKKVSRKAYNKAIKKIRDKYEKELEALEYKAEVNHWTDAKLVKERKKLYDKFNKKIDNYNKTHTIKAKKKKDRKKKTGLGTDNKRDLGRAVAELEHDKAVASIESAIDDYLGTEENLNTALKKIDAALKAQKISAEEAAELRKKAYQANVEYNMKLLDNGKLTYQEMAKILKDYYDKGMITEKEYYEYLEDAAESYKDQMKDKMEKVIDDFYDTVDKTGKIIGSSFADALAELQRLAAEGQLTAEEALEYERELYKKHLDSMFNAYRYDKKTYRDMKDMVEDYYNAGKLSAEEYYEYLQDLADEAMDKEKERLEKQKELNNNTYDLARSYVELQIDKLEKQNDELDEQNELIELQNDLEKAKSKRVRIYREGVGFVYEQDKEAIEEANKALTDYQKQQESPELKAWKEVLELFDEQEMLANIKDLENRVGHTVAELFGGMGTSPSVWTAWIKQSLAENNGLTQLLEDMDDVEYWDDVTDYLDGSGKVSTQVIDDYVRRAKFASGTLSTPAGFARVAEQGYEIGVFGLGDAVVPHNLSKNLLKWGAVSPLEYAGMTSGDSYAYSFDKLVLPNVHNANDFMRELKNLPNRALQFSGGRA